MRALASLEQAQEVLVSRCVAGDDAAWASLYTRYARTIANFLKRLGVAPDALEDAVQEVFLQAFRSLDKFRGEAAVKTWLYRLAVTQARRSRDRAAFRGAFANSSRSRVSTTWIGVNTNPAKPSACCRTRSVDSTALEREAFVLYELEGQSGAELAAIFGCPEATVYRRLHDARKKFQAFVVSEAKK